MPCKVSKCCSETNYLYKRALKGKGTIDRTLLTRRQHEDLLAQPRPCPKAPPPPKRKVKQCLIPKICPPRIDQLAIPTQKLIEGVLQDFNKTLEAERVVRLVNLAHSNREEKPRYSSQKCKKKKKKRRKNKKENCLKVWLKRRIKRSAKLIMLWISMEEEYMPNYRQLLVSMGIFKALRLKKKRRRCMCRYTKTYLMKICEQLAVFIDMEFPPYKKVPPIEPCVTVSEAGTEESRKHLYWHMPESSSEEEEEAEEEEEEEGSKESEGETGPPEDELGAGDGKPPGESEGEEGMGEGGTGDEGPGEWEGEEQGEIPPEGETEGEDVITEGPEEEYPGEGEGGDIPPEVGGPGAEHGTEGDETTDGDDIEIDVGGTEEGDTSVGDEQEGGETTPGGGDTATDGEGETDGGETETSPGEGETEGEDGGPGTGGVEGGMGQGRPESEVEIIEVPQPSDGGLGEVIIDIEEGQGGHEEGGVGGGGQGGGGETEGGETEGGEAEGEDGVEGGGGRPESEVEIIEVNPPEGGVDELIIELEEGEGKEEEGEEGQGEEGEGEEGEGGEEGGEGEKPDTEKPPGGIEVIEEGEVQEQEGQQDQPPKVEGDGSIMLVEKHPSDTVSYLVWQVYTAWLDEFAYNIAIYSKCLRRFREILEVKCMQLPEPIAKILNNWGTYLRDSIAFEATMTIYLKGKPITRCPKCGEYTLYNIPKDHDIPPELKVAVDSTLRWKQMLDEAEKLCQLYATTDEPDSLSLTSHETVQIVDCSMRTSDTSMYVFEDCLAGTSNTCNIPKAISKTCETTVICPSSTKSPKSPKTPKTPKSPKSPKGSRPASKGKGRPSKKS